MVLAVILLTLPGMPAAAKEQALTILFTNDTHNHLTVFDDVQLQQSVGGIVRRSNYFDSVRRTQPQLLVLDAGDVFQGTPLYNFFLGEPDIRLMSKAGYDAMTMGNHDLDNGMKNLRRQTQYAHFPVLCANVTDRDGLLLFRPFQIFNVYGVKIAVMGFMSQHAWNAVGTANKEGLQFEDPVAVANRLIPELRPKVDLIVGLHHAGVEFDRLYAQQIKGMDIIIGGHSHTKMEHAEVVKNSNPNGVSGTLIHHAYQWGIYVGRLDLVLDNKRIKRYASANILLDKKWEQPGPRSKELAAFLGEYTTKIDKAMSVVVGQSTADMSMKDKYNGPFPLGNLITDAIRESQKVDVGIINTGGIRADLPKGPITVGRVFQIQPFDNMLVTCQLKGSDLYKVVQQNAQRLTQSKNLQFSGLTYTIRNSPREVLAVTVGGKPLEPEKHYTVAMPDFVFSGNEEITFSGAQKPVMTGLLMRDVLSGYIQKKGTVSPPTDERLIRKD